MLGIALVEASNGAASTWIEFVPLALLVVESVFSNLETVARIGS